MILLAAALAGLREYWPSIKAQYEKATSGQDEVEPIHEAERETKLVMVDTTGRGTKKDRLEID